MTVSHCVATDWFGAGVCDGVGEDDELAPTVFELEPPPPHAATARQRAEATRRRLSSELRIGEFARTSSPGQGGVMRSSTFIFSMVLEADVSNLTTERHDESVANDGQVIQPMASRNHLQILESARCACAKEVRPRKSSAR